MKKVYFAGSIRGGRNDAGLYASMIRYIQQTDIVLTEHIGDLSLSVKEREPGADARIWEQDMAWLRECDLVIAECTNPSLGVGYELAWAEVLGKPCHIFFRGRRETLSAMLTGDAWFNIHTYAQENEVYPVIRRILDDTGKK